MLVRHGPWPVWKQFNIVQGRGRLKPGCWIATEIYINRDQRVTTKPCHHTIVSVMYWCVVVTCYRNALSDTGKICSLEVSNTFSLSLMLLKFDFVQMVLLMCNNNQRCAAAQLRKLCRAAVLKFCPRLNNCCIFYMWLTLSINWSDCSVVKMCSTDVCIVPLTPKIEETLIINHRHHRQICKTPNLKLQRHTTWYAGTISVVLCLQLVPG